MKFRTKIESVSSNQAKITYYDDLSDEIVTREFFAPISGGYVREASASYPQVCERLYNTGNTLEWYPKYGGLITSIRREWRRRQRLAMRGE